MIPENKSVTLNENYIRETHRIGKVSDAIAVILILTVPTVITLVYGKGIDIDMSKTMGAIITLTAVYGVVSVVEVVSYSPYLGTAGTYLSFITGNIMNMKLPAAMNAIRINNLDHDSEEAEVIGTLAIGASSCVTVAVLFLGMLFLGKLLVPVITGPALAPAFNNVTPALTGALAAPFFIKKLKLSIPTLIAGILVYILLGGAFITSHYSFVMLGFIVLSFLCYMIGTRIADNRKEQNGVQNDQ